MRRIVFLPILLALLITGCAPQLAQQNRLIPRALLFGNPAKSDPQVSPDGKYLSYLAPDDKNVLQILVRTLFGQDDRQLTSEQKRGTRHYTWAYDSQHLIFALRPTATKIGKSTSSTSRVRQCAISLHTKGFDRCWLECRRIFPTSC